MRKSEEAGASGNEHIPTTKRGKSADGQTSKVNDAERIQIAAPDIAILKLRIIGTAPLVINAWGEKAREEMKATQMAGSQAKSRKKREPKDFARCYEEAKHVSREGWCGIPAPAVRNAAISACRLVGFKMTIAKLSIFVVADGFDKTDGTPLIRITKGQPRHVEHMVRNATGVPDIRARPMWDEGWEAVITIRFDRGQFSAKDIVNLMSRVGMQVGLCEGRPDSKDSAGMEWGLFKIAEDAA